MTIPATMRRYELVGRREIRLNPAAPVPRPEAGQVLVEVRACTVCNRSDLAYYHYYGLREHCATGCFGHEVSGVVAAVGVGVTRVRPGERVFVRTPLTSGYAEFALAREVSVGRLPEHIGFEQGSILQLLPLAVHATRGVGLGDRVAVIGQGPVGLMALQMARMRGASHIVVADLDPWRLEQSAALGADAVHCVDGGAKALAELGEDFDVAVDAVGTPTTLNACVGLVRQNGLVVMLGTHHVDTVVPVDLVTWERKGLRVHSSAEPTDVARAQALAVAERISAERTALLHLDRLLTHTLRLEELPTAMEVLSHSRVLHPDAGQVARLTVPPRTLKIAVCP